MTEIAYLSLAEVLALHSRLIELFGGIHGVRDLGLLQSALVRPRSGYYATLSLQAASMLESFALQHPFVDGNKRVSFASTAIFLRMNGYRLTVSPHAAENFIVKKVIVGRVGLQSIAKWLEKYLTQR